MAWAESPTITSWAWPRCEDLLKHRVGVLGFVEEQEVGVDLRFGQGPHLQVVVVLEAHHTFLMIP
jgi:hypothetical protein